MQWNLLWEWIGGADAVHREAADICAVGDTDQAIYGWNGADSRYFAEFDRYFESAQVVRLGFNYRSHPLLVTAAQAVMERDGAPETEPRGTTAARAARGSASVKDGERERKATGVGGSAQSPARPHETGPAPTVTAFDDAAAEADGIARWIAHRHVGGVRWDSFGVLARTNVQLGDIAAALETRGIPFRLSGQRSPFLQLPAVQQLLEQLGQTDAPFATVVEDLRADALDASALEPGTPVPLEPVTMRVLDLADAYLARDVAHVRPPAPDKAVPPARGSRPGCGCCRAARSRTHC